MRRIDELYTEFPFYGSRKIRETLRREGVTVNRKRIQRLTRIMGLEAIYPKPKTSRVAKERRVYPYLLRNREIASPNEVCSTDITYVAMKGGFMYLVAILDCYSRYVLSWRISNSMEVEFSLAALTEALRDEKPEIFNSDQGSQFTAEEFTGRLVERNIRISMDGKGRAFDNIFVERLWRSVKYECLYLREFRDGHELYQGLKEYFLFYNHHRPHQSLNSATPAEIYQRRI